MTDDQITRLIRLFTRISRCTLLQELELISHNRITPSFCELGKEVLQLEREVSRILWTELEQ